MKPEEILQHTHHRPWPIPSKEWTLYQEWNEVIFLHWEVSMEILQNLVPPQLQIDTFEGKPWVSLVAFSTEKVRPKGLPPFPPVSNFDEINIRTYIFSGERKGIYFLSMEAAKLTSVKFTKWATELPYITSEMERGSTHFEATNKNMQSEFRMEYKVGEKKEVKPQLEQWLTERYVLFQDGREHIVEFEVLHKEWPLHEIAIEKLSVNYPPFSELLKKAPVLPSYAPGVEVLVWWKEEWKETEV